VKVIFLQGALFHYGFSIENGAARSSITSSPMASRWHSQTGLHRQAGHCAGGGPEGGGGAGGQHAAAAAAATEERWPEPAPRGRCTEAGAPPPPAASADAIAFESDTAVDSVASSQGFIRGNNSMPRPLVSDATAQCHIRVQKLA
jgi:hypothetical protein